MQVDRSFGAYLTVVVQHDRLPVQQEGQPIRVVEQLVHDIRQPLPHDAQRMVPLTIPVSVRDDDDRVGRVRFHQ